MVGTYQSIQSSDHGHYYATEVSGLAAHPDMVISVVIMHLNCRSRTYLLRGVSTLNMS
eukprot:COSAG04_NODE_12132_length_668_cov_1.260105_1_plen_58_part_00